MTSPVLFTTERGTRHQQSALAAAPPDLDVTMLRQPDRASLLAALHDRAYWISERRGVIDAGMLAAAPQLRLIVRLGSLAHDIDLAAAHAAGIAVCLWPVGNVIRVAEHLMLQLLAVGKRLRAVEAVALAAGDEWGPRRRTDEDTFAFNWSGQTGIATLWEQTVGILGFGEIGAELARRLQGWGCTVLYNKRQPLPPAAETALGVTFATRDDLLAHSDYVVNLLPYFPETDMLLNADLIAQMKSGVFVVSAGSGSVIDEAALADALRSRQVAGAALDTFEWEPLAPDNPLVVLARSGANVLLTPHTAAGTVDAARADTHAIYTNIQRHLAGKPLLHRLV